jgi:hypothetical protein
VFAYSPGDSIFLDLEGAADGAASDTVLVSGSSPQNAGGVVLVSTVFVPGAGAVAPIAVLGQNRPNPFAPSTTIVVRAERALRDASLIIADASGRVVRSIALGHLGIGERPVAWDGRADSGGRAPSGVYFYRLDHASGVSPARKAVLVE